MRVMIIDDDNLVLASLKMIVEADSEIEVVAIGTSGEEAVEKYERYQPDVLLMDIRMSGMSGLDAGEEIIGRYKDARILYLTTFNDEEYIAKAIVIGAKGYIIKQDFEGIVPSLKTVYEGNLVFGKEIRENLSKIISSDAKNTGPTRFSSLTPLELEIVKLVSDGYNNREIAEELCLSEGTVRNYISNILSKLEIRDRTNLAISFLKETE
ncbi:response regulator transcription factor [Eubacterium xylanophilum]|uniref:response regulator transcription factor n=1 Tax=Eubacterium xylanophilum TaxID=39497 RepID=UPI00047D95DA|nr:response regulator transcription factor [Eubacterium xylanophilum]MCR5796645.1 response regulator transcription factor [Eubacterium sp.]